MYVPTLTDVLPSSSEALLPPGLLLMLMRLELRAGRRMALIGRDCEGEEGVGDAGDPTIVLALSKDQMNVVLKQFFRCVVEIFLFEIQNG